MLRSLTFVFLTMTVAPVVQADERRAPAPKFTAEQTRGVFFDKLDDAFRGERPTIATVRKSAGAAAVAAAATQDSAAGGGGGDDVWTSLISASSLEDEIKRVKLEFDSCVSTPTSFLGGGYQDARLHLTVLASLFAVINEHGDDVRWKDQAAAARDLIARSAFNCKSGSNQVYNEVKLRKGDLQDLIAGSGLANKKADEQNDWTMIADRSPLMEYAEALIEALEDASRDEATIKRETELVKRNAELLAVLGEILAREGMDDADDEDYAKLSHEMTSESSKLVQALERGDAAEVRKGASMIRKRCDSCHEQYR
ncbi:MAG: cytochrome c [Rubripirellula sp.]